MESINPYVFIIQYPGEVVNCYFRKIAKKFAKFSVQIAGEYGVHLFHKLVDGLAKVINGGLVPGGYSIHHAVAHMVL